AGAITLAKHGDGQAPHLGRRQVGEPRQARRGGGGFDLRRAGGQRQQADTTDARVGVEASGDTYLVAGAVAARQPAATLPTSRRASSSNTATRVPRCKPLPTQPACTCRRSIS